jgi:hypothetical protein
MLTFGLVVEGDYDEAVLTEFIRQCAGHDVEIVSRVCNPRGSLMKRFPGFLEEFRYVKQGMPVDRALVVRDADMREPHALLRAMEAKIAHRTYAFAPVMCSIPPFAKGAIVSGTILAWKLLTVSGRNFQAF